MQKIIFVMFMLMFSTSLIMAQAISEYTFSTATNGSLEDMSSGTTDLLPTGTYYYMVSSGIADIGFAFNFGTGLYTQFSANSNGQMQLGGAVIAGSANPTAGLSILAPLANGVAGNNSIQPSGKVHYKVLGDAPNRRLVVEWLDLRIPYGNSAGTYSRMQAWLYETSNVIKFVYGTMYRNGTIQQNRGVFIASSNVAGTVGNVTTIATTPTWNITGTGTIVTSFPTNNYTNLTSAADGSRRVFTFTPPVVSNTPNPAVLVGPDNAGWAFTDAVLSWNGGGGAPTSYDVYFGTDANPPLVANQAMGNYDPALADGTTYYWKVVPKNAYGEAQNCPVWSFQTPTATQIAESFESTMWPPPGWSNPNGFSRNTTPGTAKFGIASAAKTTSPTAVYVLSTPLSAITPTSTLDFYSMAGNTTRILQVVYSSDRINWIQIGANITYPAANTWYRSTINLVNQAGNNYYLGFRTPTQTNGSTNNVFIDYVFGPEISPEVPGQVTLTFPNNGASYTVTQPTFTWNTNTTTGGVPTSYTLYVDNNPNPTTVLATTTTPSYTPTTPLNELTLYYWKVVANNSAGSSPESAIRSFTTTVYTPLPATNPVPIDGATGVAINATLSWNSVVNASYYKVFFGTSLPATQNVNQVANSWTPPTMTPGTTYYWKVVPFHQFAGDAVGSPVWSFTTMNLPLAATNPTPADTATDVIINTTLSWDEVFTAASYDVYFGTTLPGTPNANVLTPGWTPPIMDNSTTYSWKVVPKNAIGEALNCPTWTFTTGSGAIEIPLAASNPYPADLATGIWPNESLSWDAVIGATSYDVYFGTTLPIEPNANVLTPGWTPPLMSYNTLYSWVVVPKNSAGDAINNPVWSFTTSIALPLAATNPFPADNAVGVAINASLLWDAVSDADSYDVYFGTTLPVAPNANVNSPDWTPPLMQNNTLYSWKIIPKNVAGEAINNPTWSFTTIVALPDAATNPYPADEAVDVPIDAALSWDAVDGADEYDVYFGESLPSTPNATVTLPTWTPPTMANNTLYLWYVVPKNAAGAQPSVPLWYFTTIGALPMAAANPVPADYAIDVAIDATLSWDAADGADSYDVYFGTILPWEPNANVLTPGWTPPTMENDTMYEWLVVPKNAVGEALDCPIWTFTTISPTFPAPTNLQVSFNGSNVIITWDAVPQANIYRVYGANDPYAVDPWTLLDTTSALTYTYLGTEDMHFFKVTADLMLAKGNTGK